MDISKTRGQADDRIYRTETQDEDKNGGETTSRAESECLSHHTLSDGNREPETLEDVATPEPHSESCRLVGIFPGKGKLWIHSFVNGAVNRSNFGKFGSDGVARLFLNYEQFAQDVVRVCQEQIRKKMPPERPSDPPPDRHLVMSHTELKDLIINAIAAVLLIYGVPQEIVEIARHLCRRNGEPRHIPKNQYVADFRMFSGGILLVMQLAIGELELAYDEQNVDRGSLLLKLPRLLRGQKLSDEPELPATTDHSNHADSDSGEGDLGHSHNTELASLDSQSNHTETQSGSLEVHATDEHTVPQ